MHVNSLAGKPVNIPFQETSLDIWKQKYRLTDHDGNPVDTDIEATYARVADAIAEVEDESVRDEWATKFKWALEHGAIPAGRIMSNAGASKYKPATSTINCTVSRRIGDSMKDIMASASEAAMTLKAGCGIGYEFSTLRPNGAWVSGAGATTSGPLSFMDIFDKTCFTVSSAGGRRGAQMGTFDVRHPDVESFIRAKREDGRLRQFNLSLLITDDFVQAVKNDEDWNLIFPISQNEVDVRNVDLNGDDVVWADWPGSEEYINNDEGKVACRVYKTIKARKLWNLIMSSTYDFAEPGFILIDSVNEQNNNWFCEDIRATNPCGEQPLPYHGACLLGSINLTRFVLNPFTDKAAFDWGQFREVVKIFSRMLDNVVEINGLPLPEQQDEIKRKRRHGMGYMGLGSAMSMMGIPYGSDASIDFTEEVSKQLAITGWIEALDLAREKGPAPIMDEVFIVTAKMLRQRPEMKTDGLKPGDELKGRELLIKYSRYFQKVTAELPDEMVQAMLDHGLRYTHHTSIAPTGTISLSLANNASNGIEPSFSHSYLRNMIREGKKAKEQVEVASFELLAYRQYVKPDATPADLPDYCVTSENIQPRDHVRVQAASQKWIDSSISKTVNVPTETEFEDFQDLYMFAADQGLKGCTTFRFNPEAFSGVLVKQEDLENTVYVFELENGEKLELRGDEEVEYEGETVVASNLFDALKEGYYGKL